jgi:hypothetical protein
MASASLPINHLEIGRATVNDYSESYAHYQAPMELAEKVEVFPTLL